MKKKPVSLAQAVPLAAMQTFPIFSSSGRSTQGEQGGVSSKATRRKRRMKYDRATVPSEQEPVPLRRVLNLREAVALGIGGTIGGGIFVLVGTAIGQAGPGAVLSFALAFLASLLIALPYAELACRYPLAGGGYAFARAVLGRHWGFFMGWDYWGAYLFISGYVTLGFGSYLHSLLGIPPLFGALGLITCCTIINLLGVK